MHVAAYLDVMYQLADLAIGLLWVFLAGCKTVTLGDVSSM